MLSTEIPIFIVMLLPPFHPPPTPSAVHYRAISLWLTAFSSNSLSSRIQWWLIDKLCKKIRELFWILLTPFTDSQKFEFHFISSTKCATVGLKWRFPPPRYFQMKDLHCCTFRFLNLISFTSVNVINRGKVADFYFSIYYKSGIEE